jgi:hypothetical protein
MAVFPHTDPEDRRTDLPVPVERHQPFNSGMSAIGPLSALFVGILGFALFVFGASRIDHGAEPQQTAGQQQPADAAKTGLSPQAQQQERARGRETTGAAPIEQQQDNPPSTAKTGVPPAR